MKAKEFQDIFKPFEEEELVKRSPHHRRRSKYSNDMRRYLEICLDCIGCPEFNSVICVGCEISVFESSIQQLHIFNYHQIEIPDEEIEAIDASGWANECQRL